MVGEDGSLPAAAILTHTHARIGAKMIRKNEFIDWNQLLGNAKPRNVLSVLRSAKRFSVDPACSNTDQNSAAARNSTPIT